MNVSKCLNHHVNTHGDFQVPTVLVNQPLFLEIVPQLNHTALVGELLSELHAAK